MKALRFLFSLALLPGTLALGVVLPEALPATRYDKLLEDSPFAVATPTAAPAEPVKGWAENLYLGPVAHITKDGEEKDFIVVKSRADPTASFTLIGSEPSSDGIQLVKLEWSTEPAKAKAVVKKGTEFATLEVNQADFTQPAAPIAQPRPNGAQPGVPIPNAANAIRRPLTAPAQPVIPRPTGALGMPVNPAPANRLNQPSANQNPTGQNPNDRKRIRVINSQ